MNKNDKTEITDVFRTNFFPGQKMSEKSTVGNNIECFIKREDISFIFSTRLFDRG